MRKFLATLLLCAMVAGATSAHAKTVKPHYPEHSVTMRAWFKNAKPTPEARAKYGWGTFGCCEFADRVKVKFAAIDRSKDEWRFQCPTLEEDEFAAKYCAGREKNIGDWVAIPAEIVHSDRPEPPKDPQYHDETDPQVHAEFQQLRHEGVLFIANLGGNLIMMCFWPPEEEN